jgi:hypothetical protein
LTIFSAQDGQSMSGTETEIRRAPAVGSVAPPEYRVITASSHSASKAVRLLHSNLPDRQPPSSVAVSERIGST